MSRMRGKLSRTVLRRGKGSNPFSLVDFTNPDYIRLLKESGVRISMDGKGQCLDNAITERFFRTLKYDRIYVYEIRNPRELRKILNEYMVVYNHKRPHDSLGGIPPAYVHETMEAQRKSA